MKPKKDEGRRFRAELNALALLLCAPSDLNQAWTKCSKDQLDAVIKAQLDALPFSSEVRDRAEKVMTQLHDVRDKFGFVANRLMLFMWTDGEIPHPNPQTARRIIELIKDLPDE